MASNSSSFCAAPNCGNSRRTCPNVSYFRFPKDGEGAKKWRINARAGRLDALSLEELNKNRRLCSKHFEDNQFMNSNKNKLVWNAIPTLFDVPNPPKKITPVRKPPKKRRHDSPMKEKITFRQNEHEAFESSNVADQYEAAPPRDEILETKMASSEKEEDENKHNGVNEEEDDDEEVKDDEIESEGEDDDDDEENKGEGSGELDGSEEGGQDEDGSEPASKRQKTKRHRGYKSKEYILSEDESEEVGDVLICEECDLKFENQEAAEEHKKQHENGTIQNSGASGTDDAAVAERRRKLAQFTDEQILAKLVERQAAFVCVCGIIFRDQTLYYLHRGCHNSENPQQCSFCKFVAKDWYDFTTHFFVHKKNKLKSEEVEDPSAT